MHGGGLAANPTPDASPSPIAPRKGRRRNKSGKIDLVTDRIRLPTFIAFGATGAPQLLAPASAASVPGVSYRRDALDLYGTRAIARPIHARRPARSACEQRVLARRLGVDILIGLAGFALGAGGLCVATYAKAAPPALPSGDTELSAGAAN